MDDICEFINGGAWSDKEYVFFGLPVLKVSNCKLNGFQLDNINYLPISLKEKYKKNKLQLGDVIIATVGSHPNLEESAAGRSCIINSSVSGFYLNQNAVCLRTKDSNVLNQKYLGYLCQERNFVHYIQNKGRGAANQMRIAIGSIKDYKFELPEPNIQIKIANILSAYDDLIENNQKQIKLLEEAAQRLYKEWFVDLRFPGHEQTKLIDGVPEGWKISTLDKVANLKAGGDKPKVYSDIVNSVCKIPIYSNGSENEGLYGYTDKARILEECITISARGNVGYTCLRRTPFVPIVRLISVIPIDIDVIYLYYYLKNLSFDSNGAAQQQITIPMIKEYKVIVPSEEILLEYRKVACSIHDKIDIIKNQNTLLKEARDRLLPKLMSGEIEV